MFDHEKAGWVLMKYIVSKQSLLKNEKYNPDV